MEQATSCPSSSSQVPNERMRRIRRETDCASTFSSRPVFVSPQVLASLGASSRSSVEESGVRKGATTASARSRRWWEHTGRGSVKILRGKPKLMTGCTFGSPPDFMRKKALAGARED